MIGSNRISKDRDIRLSKSLTHLDESGTARMVDVGQKADTERVAVAAGEVVMHLETVNLIRDGLLKKGDALTIARIAGIMAAKRTSELIPLCHPIALTHLDVTLSLDEGQHRILIQATARTIGKTGVEMEALTAVSARSFKYYQKAKTADRTMHTHKIHAIAK